LTLALAWVTWRWVETPFRDRHKVSTRALVWSAVAATLVVSASAAYLAFGGDTERRSPVATNAVAQSVLSLFTNCDPHRQPTRDLGVGCLLDPGSAAPPSFLVVGNSHADALFPAFARMSRETGRQGRLVQHLICLPLLEVTTVLTDVQECSHLQELALDLVQRERLTRVFIVSRFSYIGTTPNIAERLERTIAAYAERGATVYLVAQVPEQHAFDRRRYVRAVLADRFLGIDASRFVREQSASRADHDRIQAVPNAIFAAHRDDPRVRIVDLASAFCDDVTCRVGTTSHPYYQDEHHLTSSGALLVSQLLASAR
jgi:hypothetical protein